MHPLSPPDSDTFADVLRRTRLAAIVRGQDPDAALRTVLTLAEEGVALVEVSLNTTDALGVIRRAAAEVGPGTLIGAGTVLTEEDVARAHEAGAGWMVTPALTESVTASVRAGLPVLAGALTPTEAVAARRAGADAVKLFPASLGGPAYLKALRDPFPDMPIVPVGGVDLAGAERYLAHGAVAVGVGSPLVGDAAHGGDLAALRQRARGFVALCSAGTREDV
ncbi:MULTISPECIES: bifunctional 4-hydroxy-2-oxoglutarate aldolase/2-dehydro-3-deoxy-phosphogluconate aldolase [Streptomyces]|uniref:KDPG and KHG aldolase n=1 Tax=Streptomyces pratensis (strain ATCC 33331 / IAF-45CD) TaxID=591167 RepID=A0A8D3WR33_STRFA|nr:MULTISPECIES: bifunctional 4-hydroxy-2-oxoglutarate aldolase/2-dehydro-3-deoxy-phosphogluconate aldolase [Streptomyces]RAS22949.1 2-keto-3-deoxy-phosphogluconate aldolase [Streptomyces avidinii]SNX75766.1 2-keto-3-deoxy-phosphogluconate aldolase [Streptomyces microflavus]MDF6061053.1 bifunctional 4-hydroxy-2-oxoglutarate aldolase/2-dehydro-3-deoxy-phosphogluconate aldolase [Streptomyces sp. JH010]MYT54434.1 aldolase [Streptomyces sp. SID7815]MYT60876.1 aldolase [Streptomyces sp. SID7834]